MDTTRYIPARTLESTGTAVNCEREGHCLHEGTALGSLYCCKCGKYISYGRSFEYISETKWKIS